MSAAEPVLELRDVSAGYGPFRALLGAHGAGKTTLARLATV